MHAPAPTFVGEEMLSEPHGRACPDHPENLEPDAFRIEITGTRPVMTVREG
jgi:hypothetical protein